MTTEGASVVAREEVRDWDGRLELTDDGEMEAEPKLAEPELNLLEPLLKRLELARNPDLELLPKAGVAWGAELAGVAIRVGFTLCLVRVATVVATRRLLGRKGLVGFLPCNGLMTGVKVFPGRLNETRPRVLLGFTPSSASSSSSSSSEERVRSLSMSWKEVVGEMVLAELGVAMVETEMMSTSASPDWISGTAVRTGPEVE